MIRLPQIDRGRDSKLNDVTINGLKSHKSFPGLESLTFVVGDDILTGNIQPLRRLRDSVPETCHVALDIRDAFLYHKDGGWDFRQVHISSEAVRKMQKWGWAMNGEWELVDRHHPLRHEKYWRTWLQRNHQGGV